MNQKNPLNCTSIEKQIINSLKNNTHILIDLLATKSQDSSGIIQSFKLKSSMDSINENQSKGMSFEDSFLSIEAWNKKVSEDELINYDEFDILTRDYNCNKNALANLSENLTKPLKKKKANTNTCNVIQTKNLNKESFNPMNNNLKLPYGNSIRFLDITNDDGTVSNEKARTAFNFVKGLNSHKNNSSTEEIQINFESNNDHPKHFNTQRNYSRDKSQLNDRTNHTNNKPYSDIKGDVRIDNIKTLDKTISEGLNNHWRNSQTKIHKSKSFKKNSKHRKNINNTCELFSENSLRFLHNCNSNMNSNRKTSIKNVNDKLNLTNYHHNDENSRLIKEPIYAMSLTELLGAEKLNHDYKVVIESKKLESDIVEPDDIFRIPQDSRPLSRLDFVQKKNPPGPPHKLFENQRDVKTKLVFDLQPEKFALNLSSINKNKQGSNPNNTDKDIKLLNIKTKSASNFFKGKRTYSNSNNKYRPMNFNLPKRQPNMMPDMNYDTRLLIDNSTNMNSMIDLNQKSITSNDLISNMLLNEPSPRIIDKKFNIHHGLYMYDGNLREDKANQSQFGNNHNVINTSRKNNAIIDTKLLLSTTAASTATIDNEYKDKLLSSLVMHSNGNTTTSTTITSDDKQNKGLMIKGKKGQAGTITLDRLAKLNNLKNEINSIEMVDKLNIYDHLDHDLQESLGCIPKKNLLSLSSKDLNFLVKPNEQEYSYEHDMHKSHKELIYNTNISMKIHAKHHKNKPIRQHNTPKDLSLITNKSSTMTTPKLNQHKDLILEQIKGIKDKDRPQMKLNHRKLIKGDNQFDSNMNKGDIEVKNPHVISSIMNNSCQNQEDTELRLHYMGNKRKSAVGNLCKYDISDMNMPNPKGTSYNDGIRPTIKRLSNKLPKNKSFCEQDMVQCEGFRPFDEYRVNNALTNIEQKART